MARPDTVLVQSAIKDPLPGRQGHAPPHHSRKSKSRPQLIWRSSSEPPGQFQDQRFAQQASQPTTPATTPAFESYTSDLKNGMRHYLDNDSIASAEKMQIEVDKEESGEYNYVLNSLASDVSDNAQINSLPASPMHVPVKHPKSIQYVLTSDEEEPQDLSYGSLPDEEPQNLTVTKPMKLAASGPMPSKAGKIKYDSNANAVAVSPKIAHLEKTQFIAQPPFSVPQNLIFNDRRTVNNDPTVQPQVFQVPHSSNISSSQEPAIRPSPQGGLILAAQPPHLQVVNVIGGASPLAGHVYVQPSIIPTKSSFPSAAMPALRPIVTSPDAQTIPKHILQGSDSGDEQLSPGRRKRKKVEDTTLFRDPPETSLPFNGPNKYRFYCDVCDTGFTRRYTFNRHKCKGRVEKHYCQLCDKAYLSKYKLKDHILVKHEGQTVSCPDCGKKFSSRSSMEMHKKQQHEGQFSIWCKICGKGFNHTGHYYGHMNKHTNTKPFWCQQCGKRFYGSSYLHNHKQVCRGNNDLNYPCTVCDRKFKCELYLKKHMKTHENIPIIIDPSVTKLSGADLSEAGVGLPRHELEENGSICEEGEMRGPVMADSQENSDSNSNSGLLVIDENMNAEESGMGKKVMMDREAADLSKSDKLNVQRTSQQEVTA